MKPYGKPTLEDKIEAEEKFPAGMYFCTECGFSHFKNTFYYEDHKEFEGTKKNFKLDPTIDDGSIDFNELFQEGFKMQICKKCGKCCTNYPCALEPKDLQPIANFLKISKEELIKKYLIWDYWIGDIDNLYYLCPKRQGDTEQIANFAWAFDKNPCIFLTNENLCRIHPVKPRGGKEQFCEDDNNHKFSKFEATELWKKELIYPFNEEVVR